MRIFTILAIFLLVTLSIPASSQQCIPVYRNTYGGNGNDEATSVRSTPDGGSIVAGRTTSNSAGNYDGFLMKLSPTGVIEWSRNYGFANMDEFTTVLPVFDGYIASGHSRSFSNPFGEPIIIKVDLTGNLLWAKKPLTDNSARHRVKDIIELTDGSIVALINEHDSTSSGNGIVTRLSSSGTVSWSKTFNNNDVDFFNTVVQKGDTLLVGGATRTSSGNMAGVIIKLALGTGAHLGSWTITQKSNPSHPATDFDNQVLMVAPTAKGYMFTNASRYNNDSYRVWSLSHCRINFGGDFLWGRTMEASTVYGFASFLATKPGTREGTHPSFLFLISDSTNYGVPELSQQAGTFDHQRKLRQLEDPSAPLYARYSGFDTTEQKGYIVAGFTHNQFPLNDPNKITVQKLDELMRNGNCTGTLHSTFDAPAAIDIAPFTWASVTNSADVSANDISLPEAPNGFARINNCEDSYCTPAPGVSPTCLSSFSLNIRGERSANITDVAFGSGGYYLLGGSYQYSSAEALVTKLQNNGTVIWSKQLSNNLDEGMVQRIVDFGTGEVAVGINNAGLIDHYSNEYVTISKLDPQGNQLWTTKLESGGGLRLYDMVATPDGGVIFIANRGWGSTPIDNWIVRMDGSGNVLWDRRMQNPLTLVIKTLLLDGNDLYVGYDRYQNSTRLQVERWNATTGQRTWNKSVEFSQYDGLDMQGIFRIGNTLFVAMNSYKVNGANVENQTLFVKMGTAGELQGGFRVIAPNKAYPLHGADVLYAEHRAFYVAKTRDDQFVISQEVDNGVAHAIAILKVTPDGGVTWSRQVPALNNHSITSLRISQDNILVSGVIGNSTVLTEPRVDRSFLLNFTSQGELTDDAAAGCQAEDIDAGTDPIAPAYSGFDEVATVNNGGPGWLDVTNYITNVLEAQPATIFTSFNCYTPDRCSDLFYLGPGYVCDTTLDYTFGYTRSPGCTNPVQITYASSMVNLLSRTDTSITVHFLAMGNFSVSGVLASGCATIVSDRIINVVTGAKDMTLGRDTALCPGNSLTMFAYGNFTDVTWQDGAHESNQTVTEPGLYYVDVTDVCGYSKRDSIIISASPPLVLDLGADRLICAGDTVRLQGPPGLRQYAWSPDWYIGSLTTPSTLVYPRADTAYILTAQRNDGCSGSDTIRIDVRSTPVINLGTDTSFCINGSLLLDAGAGFTGYAWSTGAATSTIQVDNEGAFSIDATDAQGCHSRDTIVVLGRYPLPDPGLEATTVICRGLGRTLTAVPGLTNYLWNTGGSANEITVTAPGTYSVLVTDQHGCVGEDTVRISYIVSPPAGFLSADTAICSYGSIQLKPGVNFDDYHWSTGGTSPSIDITLPGVYWLTATDANGCKGTDSVLVSLKDCMIGVYVPTAFTPNGDGVNDVFMPAVYGPLKYYRFTVFDRWGQVVFRSSEPGRGWDGKVGGINRDAAVFVWICEWEIEGMKRKFEKGIVGMVR